MVNFLLFPVNPILSAMSFSPCGNVHPLSRSVWKANGVADVHFLFTASLHFTCFTCKTTSGINGCKHCFCKRETSFQVISKKNKKKQVWLKWAVLFSACGTVCLIPSLLSNHVSIKVKSCFFFFFCGARAKPGMFNYWNPGKTVRKEMY